MINYLVFVVIKGRCNIQHTYTVLYLCQCQEYCPLVQHHFPQCCRCLPVSCLLPRQQQDQPEPGRKH